MWLNELNSTCNSLTSNYLTLLKSAAPAPSGGGGYNNANDRSDDNAIFHLLDEEMADAHAYKGVMTAIDKSGDQTGSSPAIAGNGNISFEIPTGVSSTAHLLGLETRIAAENIVEVSEKLLLLIRQLRTSVLLCEGGDVVEGGGNGNQRIPEGIEEFNNAWVKLVEELKLLEKVK